MCVPVRAEIPHLLILLYNQGVWEREEEEEEEMVPSCFGLKTWCLWGGGFVTSWKIPAFSCMMLSFWLDLLNPCVLYHSYLRDWLISVPRTGPIECPCVFCSRVAGKWIKCFPVYIVQCIFSINNSCFVKPSQTNRMDIRASGGREIGDECYDWHYTYLFKKYHPQAHHPLPDLRLRLESGWLSGFWPMQSRSATAEVFHYLHTYIYNLAIPLWCLASTTYFRPANCRLSFLDYSL